MNPTLSNETRTAPAGSRPLWIAGGGAAVVLLAWLLFPPAPGPTADRSVYEVKRGDFLISIVEGGTLEAVNEVVIRSEVEGIARIIFIVKEGVYVKKGDPVVELDASGAEDQLNQQQINFEKAQFALIQAQQQLDIQKSIVDSEVQAAELKLEFAEKDLEKYLKGEALQQYRNAQIEITNVMESLKIAEERLQWSDELYKQGFETKGNLDRDKLTVSQTKLKLEQAQLAIELLQTFDHPKRKRQFEAAVDEAKQNLARVKLQGERRLEQYKADLTTQQNTLDLSSKKLERDRRQLAACKIKAPQDGMVVYPIAGGHFSTESMIEEGASVRNRQELIKLPDVSEMKLQVKVHESYINQIKEGQMAFVVLDSMPDKRFGGVVAKVAPLPDTQSRWANPNLKVYVTTVLVTDKLPDVKPGVSARAEIVITNLPNVVTVPVQAVTTLRGKPVVYALDGESSRPVSVEVGMYNQRFIQIVSGIKEGDRVLLSPPMDTQEKDLGGAILAKGEKVPSDNGTNRAARQALVSRLPRNGQSESGGAEGQGFGERLGLARPDGREGGDREAGAGGEPGRTKRPQGFNREEMLKQFDKDGDGELNEEERAAMRAARPGRGSGPRLSREEMLKRFDKNGDGELDEQERTAMFDDLRSSRGRTNAPPTNAPPQAPPPGTGAQ